MPTSATAMVIQNAVGVTHYSALQIGIAYISSAAWCIVGTLLTLRVARWRAP
ncbi:hypothetical protein [Vulcanisaeta distributa]|uniref:hypothetical protein n=1 Tax=Vulcanisaeta distributa TaxID=164451 RepID=UPI001FB2E9D5|nr:hypothetical protein [Vulcanisaeta distributa]